METQVDTKQQSRFFELIKADDYIESIHKSDFSSKIPFYMITVALSYKYHEKDR